MAERVFMVAASLAAVVALAPLLWVLVVLVMKGAPSLDLDFFTKLPKPLGVEGGGMANAVVGSLMVVGLGSAIALPLGVLGGVYTREYAGVWGARAVRLVSDVLAGVPSIVLGVFVWAVVVVAMRRFSALAGGLALALVMLPTVQRSTDEVLALVPQEVREGALALGIPKWKAVLWVVVPSAAGGILSGALLAVARAAGETAPLLLTALGNRFWNLRPDRPVATLPVMIFNYAISPYEDWHRQAWAAALVLVAGVLLLTLGARWVLRRKYGGS